jgi:RES domain-containing protein
MGPAGLKLYRIGSGRHAVFQGEGARLHGGRWNSPGRPVVYGGASFAIAMLERLVYAAIGKVPRDDRWVEAEVPDDLVEVLDETVLPGWDGADSAAARAYGDRWLDEARSAALLVPSVVTRIDRNLVVNPFHPGAARITVGAERPVRWDHRLFGRVGAPS